jgi:hypothetical protein
MRYVIFGSRWLLRICNLDLDAQGLVHSAFSCQTLRSVHGVACTDGFTISFQPQADGNRTLLLHHSHEPKDSGVGDERLIGGKLPQPIEFRRRVMMRPAPKIQFLPRMAEAASPMTKLLMEEERMQEPRMIPWVEVYPIKLNFTVVQDPKTRPAGSKDFVLVSRRSRAIDALQGLMKAAAPQTISTCRRVWSKRANPGTKNPGDGYELVDLDGLDGKLLRKEQDGDSPKPQLSVEEWIKTHAEGEGLKELDVLVEIRRANETWPRESLEFGNRLEVGDFVDAQDSAGKWYEALVRRIEGDLVTVHYFGWASKWDSTIRRRLDSTGEGMSAVSIFCVLYT